MKLDYDENNQNLLGELHKTMLYMANENFGGRAKSEMPENQEWNSIGDKKIYPGHL